MNNIIISIDSRLRDINKYKNSSKFSVSIGDRIKNVKSIKLVSFEFPRLINFLVLYNTISNDIKDNSNFKIIIGVAEYIISVKDGHYNKINLITAINDLIKLLNIGITFSIVKNDKINISSTLTNFTIDFTNNEAYPSLGKILGFLNNIYSDTNLIESDIDINIPTDNYIYIKINDYGNMYTINNNVLNNSSYLCKVSFNNNAEIVFISEGYKFINPTNIDKLDIEILNPYLNNINLSNINYSFTLELET